MNDLAKFERSQRIDHALRCGIWCSIGALFNAQHQYLWPTFAAAMLVLIGQSFYSICVHDPLQRKFRKSEVQFAKIPIELALENQSLRTRISELEMRGLGRDH